jgi:hypothetical protein
MARRWRSDTNGKNEAMQAALLVSKVSYSTDPNVQTKLLEDVQLSLLLK